jgi:hypothetical protein
MRLSSQTNQRARQALSVYARYQKENTWMAGLNIIYTEIRKKIEQIGQTDD